MSEWKLHSNEERTRAEITRRAVLWKGVLAVGGVTLGSTAYSARTAAHGGASSVQPDPRATGTTTATQRDTSGTDNRTVEDEGQPGRGDENRAPIILEDGSKHYFTYELDTGAVADWTEADRDGEPVWNDDEAVHWIDTAITDLETDRLKIRITIYQEVVFTVDCDGSEIAHPALSPAEWARQDAVSNMDYQSWLVLMAVDELKAAFDHVVWQLNDRADETPPEKFGVATEQVELFQGLTGPGTCRIELVGVDPHQVVTATDGPRPTARNGSVAVRVPVTDWSRMHRDTGTDLGIRPHQFVANWRQILANPIAVNFTQPRHLDKLVGREPCDVG